MWPRQESATLSVGVCLARPGHHFHSPVQLLVEMSFLSAEEEKHMPVDGYPEQWKLPPRAVVSLLMRLAESTSERAPDHLGLPDTQLADRYTLAPDADEPSDATWMYATRGYGHVMLQPDYYIFFKAVGRLLTTDEVLVDDRGMMLSMGRLDDMARRAQADALGAGLPADLYTMVGYTRVVMLYHHLRAATKPRETQQVYCAAWDDSNVLGVSGEDLFSTFCAQAIHEMPTGIREYYFPKDGTLSVPFRLAMPGRDRVQHDELQAYRSDRVTPFAPASPAYSPSSPPPPDFATLFAPRCDPPAKRVREHTRDSD